jgi:hypothetical protein
VQSVVDKRGGACEWVVQSRVDADDYLGRDFVETVADLVANEQRVAVDGPGWCNGCGAGHAPPDVVAVSQPRLTRVYLFGSGGGGGNARRVAACPVRRTAYSTRGVANDLGGHTPSSLGLTVALRSSVYAKTRYDINSLSHPAITQSVFAMRRQGYKVATMLLAADRNGLAPVTSLSGHFPWFDDAPHEPCDFRELMRIFGRSSAQNLQRLRLPQATHRIACMRSARRGLI